MSAFITPTTELEAVNLMLSAITESPVASLDDEIGTDISLAVTLLRSTNRSVQIKGWYWNTEEDRPLVPNTDNEIILPSNILKVDPSSTDWRKQYVQRGNRLYDRENFTFTIMDPVKVRLTVILDFTDLPEVARNYITVRATRLFQDRAMGDDGLHMFNMRDEQEARMELESAESEYADYNMGDNDPMLQRMSLFRRRGY